MRIGHPILEFLTGRLGPALPLRQLDSLTINVHIGGGHRISARGGDQRPLGPDIVVTPAEDFQRFSVFTRAAV